MYDCLLRRVRNVNIRMFNKEGMKCKCIMFTKEVKKCKCMNVY